MSPTLDEVRARLVAAMDGSPGEDWLDEAERGLRAYANMRRRQRMYDVSTVGARIRTARECRGMSRAQLALRLDVHVLDVRGWELGTRDIPARKLPGLLLSLAVTRPWLLMETDEGAPVPYAVIRRPKDPRAEQRRRQQARWAEAKRLRDELRAKYGSGRAQAEPEQSSG